MKGKEELKCVCELLQSPQVKKYVQDYYKKEDNYEVEEKDTLDNLLESMQISVDKAFSLENEQTLFQFIEIDSFDCESCLGEYDTSKTLNYFTFNDTNTTLLSEAFANYMKPHSEGRCIQCNEENTITRDFLFTPPLLNVLVENKTLKVEEKIFLKNSEYEFFALVSDGKTIYKDAIHYEQETKNIQYMLYSIVSDQ